MSFGEKGVAVQNGDLWLASLRKARNGSGIGKYKQRSW